MISRGLEASVVSAAEVGLKSLPFVRCLLARSLICSPLLLTLLLLLPNYFLLLRVLRARVYPFNLLVYKYPLTSTSHLGFP